MLKAYKLEYKNIVVGFRLCFEDVWFDISMESLQEEEDDKFIEDRYKRYISKGKDMDVLHLVATEGGLLKSEEELKGSVGVDIVDVSDDYDDRMWLFSKLDEVVDKIVEKEREEYAKKCKNYSDVVAIIKEVLSENKSKLKLGEWYDDVCLVYGNYKYTIDTDIDVDTLRGITIDLNYDIEKYANAPFIIESEDYCGVSKDIDYSSSSYKQVLKEYEDKKMNINDSKSYVVDSKSYLTLEDKDWLSYKHTMVLKFKKPIKITKSTISKLMHQFY